MKYLDVQTTCSSRCTAPGGGDPQKFGRRGPLQSNLHMHMITRPVSRDGSQLHKILLLCFPITRPISASSLRLRTHNHMLCSREEIRRLLRRCTWWHAIADAWIDTANIRLGHDPTSAAVRRMAALQDYHIQHPIVTTSLHTPPPEVPVAYVIVSQTAGTYTSVACPLTLETDHAHTYPTGTCSCTSTIRTLPGRARHPGGIHIATWHAQICTTLDQQRTCSVGSDNIGRMAKDL